MQPMAAALTLGLCCALAQLPALGLALRNQIVAALGAPLVSGRSWGSPHPMAQPGGWLASPPNCGGRNRGARSLGRAVGPLDAWGSSPGPAVGEDGGATSVVRSLARGRPKSGPNGKLHLRRRCALKSHARCPIAGPSPSHHDKTDQCSCSGQCHRSTVTYD